MGILIKALCTLGGLALMAINGLKNKLGNKDYLRNSLSDQINVDRELEEYRESIAEKVSEEEKRHIEEVGRMFSELKEKTEGSFPDLVEIIDRKQEAAGTELSGTVMQYVKEHISKNDERFLRVLEMQPGTEKCNALDSVLRKVLEEAEALFYGKMKKYVEEVQEIFSGRLESRMEDRDKQLQEYIRRLEHLEEQADKDNLDMDALMNECTPIMEAAGCILTLLETE